MTLRTPPSWLQNGSHPAENDRLTTQALYATTGIIGSGSLAVTQNSPVGMSVRVAAGWASIIGTTQANMGAYVIYNDATDVLTITASDPTNPRIDRVVATVQDAYYTGSANNVIFQVIAGTPAGSPSAPATPANSISLATIAVAAAATQIVTANITDTRVATTTNLAIGDLTEVAAGTGISVTNGTGPIPTVAIDSTVATLTGAQVLTNKIYVSPEERTTVTATAATGTVNFDLVTQAVLYYTSNATGNFTLNFRGNSGTTLNSLLAVGDSISAVFLNTNGTTARYATAFEIDGTSVTPQWSGGAAPTAGNASSIDSYSFTIIKTAATPTYTVLAGGPVKFA